MNSYSFEAVVDLPYALQIPGSFVGTRFEVEIKGVRLYLCFPDFHKVRGSKETGSFKFSVPKNLQIDWQKQYPTSSKWGSVSSWNATKGKRGIRSVDVHKVILLSRDEVTKSAALAIRNEATDYAKVLCAWVRVVLRNAGGNSIEVKQAGQGVMAVVIKNKKVHDLGHGTGHITLHSNRTTLKLSKAQMRNILVKATNQELPPVPHLYLSEARKLMARKQYRRSVLEAATATELALTHSRDKLLENTEPAVSAMVQSKFQQIGRLIEFHKGMNVLLPVRVQQEVAEPRNKAIHEGYEPDEQTTRACIAKAQEVVDQVFDLNLLLKAS